MIGRGWGGGGKGEGVHAQPSPRYTERIWQLAEWRKVPPCCAGSEETGLTGRRAQEATGNSNITTGLNWELPISGTMRSPH